MKNTLLLLACGALLAACKSSVSADDDRGIAYRTLSYGYQSGIMSAGLRVARTDEEWRALWRAHASTVIPRPAPPAVDWEQEMVLCVALGPRPTGGFGVSVDQIVMRDGALVVEATETKPAPEAIEPQFVTQPYRMIATARCECRVDLVVR